MQAVSSSGDYDAPAEVGVIDFDALADLPLDRRWFPKPWASGLRHGGYPAARRRPETFAVDATDTLAKSRSRRESREVQKRYRERRRPKDLGAK